MHPEQRPPPVAARLYDVELAAQGEQHRKAYEQSRRHARRGFALASIVLQALSVGALFSGGNWACGVLALGALGTTVAAAVL